MSRPPNRDIDDPRTKGREPRDPAFDGAHEPASLGVTGEIGGFEAGAHYRSVGKRLDRLIGAPAALKDREGHELWVAQRLGLLKLRLSDSQLSAVTAEVSVSEWPVLGLTLCVGRLRADPAHATVEAMRW